MNILYFLLPTLGEGSKYCSSGEGILPYEKVTSGLCKDPITNELECQNASIYFKDMDNNLGYLKSGINPNSTQSRKYNNSLLIF